jgi:predicted DNA-binding transcriptional regulator YafY
MRRQSRLFALAEYLRGRRTGVTAETLAERFGVTPRTIYRDLDALRDASLPVQADRGRGGGYALDRNYTLPPVNFTAREAALLVAVGGWAASMRYVPFSDTLRAALDKVRGALSASAQREALAHAGTLRFVGVPAPGGPPEVRRMVEEAWFEQRPVRLDYRRNYELFSRSVRIRGVIMERGMTLLECDDLDEGQPHTIRFDRIERATWRATQDT